MEAEWQELDYRFLSEANYFTTEIPYKDASYPMAEFEREFIFYDPVRKKYSLGVPGQNEKDKPGLDKNETGSEHKNDSTPSDPSDD